MLHLHASAVALSGRAVLIMGPPGAGKSTLSLVLMAMGAGLVSDDQTLLRVQDGQLLADAPAALRGRIEARGIGLLRATPVGPMPVHLAVDLGQREDQRLPPWRNIQLLDQSVPLVLGPYGPHLGPALRQYLVAGRSD